MGGRGPPYAGRFQSLRPIGRKTVWVGVRIYTLCLLGMRHSGFRQEIALYKLFERIGQIVGGRDKAPDCSTVKRALQQLSGDMVNALGDNAPVEYDTKTERAYFPRPVLHDLYPMGLRPEVGEPEPDIR